MVEFHFKDEKNLNTLTFDMVKEDQFFVDDENQLCQKVSETEYNVLTDSKGKPWCDHLDNIDEDIEISRIISHVSEITF